jgi:hypothetical protein
MWETDDGRDVGNEELRIFTRLSLRCRDSKMKKVTEA